MGKILVNFKRIKSKTARYQYIKAGKNHKGVKKVFSKLLKKNELNICISYRKKR